MATKLCFLVVLCLATVALGDDEVSHKRRSNYLVDGRGAARLKRIEEFTKELAELVRKLETPPECHYKLRDMANELVFTTQSAIYALNQAIPSVKNEKLHKSLCEVSVGFALLAHEIQEDLHGSIDDLKKCLASALDKTCELAKKIAEILKGDECKDEVFAANQLRQCITLVSFAGEKLKYEIVNVKKNVKELGVEIDSLLVSFDKALRGVKTDDPRFRDELIHMSQNVERIEANSIIKLENYIHIAPQGDKSVPIVKEAAKGTSLSRDAFHHLACSEEDAAKMVVNYEKLAKDLVGIIEKLASCEVQTDTLGELYVRSIIIDYMTIAHVHERLLNHLSTTTPTSA